MWWQRQGSSDANRLLIEGQVELVEAPTRRVLLPSLVGQLGALGPVLVVNRGGKVAHALQLHTRGRLR